MRTVVVMDFGGEMWKNEFTGVTISGRCFAIEEIEPMKDTTIYIIPNNVVDTFIKDNMVRIENADKLSIYNKNNYTKVSSISNLGGYTVPIVFTEVVFPVSPSDNYVSSEVKKFLHSLGMKEVAPNIKSYIMSFIAELNKGNITDGKLDRVNKFLGYFGAKVSRIEITAMNEAEKMNHANTYNTSNSIPAVAPSTTGVVVR